MTEGSISQKIIFFDPQSGKARVAISSRVVCLILRTIPSIMWASSAADMILFATPVYWWGMSAQLKLIIDKCYCRGLQLKNKKVGTIVVGGSPVDSIQYELIDKQFDCMAKYLSWDMLFKKSYYATARDELEKNKDSMNELEGIGKNL